MILAMSLPCWLIPLLTGLICGILGYLLGRLLGGNSNEVTKLQADLNACRKKTATLQSDLETSMNSDAGLQAKLDTEVSKNIALQNELNALKANMSSESASVASSLTATSAIAFNAALAKSVFGKKVKENDLTIVEGIGPKIQELFHNHNVKTWLGLSECSVEKCQEVLESGGAKFKMHNPETWSKQAGLAANGKWQELKDWQDVLDGGR